MNIESTKLILDGDSIKDVTPEIVAELWCGMDDSQQAAFFNEVARIASPWWGGGVDMQLQYVTDNSVLSLQGRRVMQSIGEYSHWGLVPKVREGKVG
jgi:hypothetical protein